MLFMHDYLNNMLPISFNGMFVSNLERRPNVHTRQSNLLHVPRCYTNFSRKLPPYVLPSIWNRYHTIELETRSTTKRKLKHIMLDTYSSHVTCQNPRCRDCNM